MNLLRRSAHDRIDVNRLLVALRLFGVFSVVAPSAACLTFQDQCENVDCPERQICIELEEGPRCVCDANHVGKGDACIEPDEPDELNAPDAGPEQG